MTHKYHGELKDVDHTCDALENNNKFNELSTIDGDYDVGGIVWGIDVRYYEAYSGAYRYARVRVIFCPYCGVELPTSLPEETGVQPPTLRGGIPAK